MSAERPFKVAGEKSNDNRGIDMISKIYSLHETSVPSKADPSPFEKSIHSEWPLPLPKDIIYNIIHAYLLRTSVRSLSLTCRSLASFCRPFNFRVVTLDSTTIQGLTRYKRFARLLGSSPDIAEYIYELRIRNTGNVTSQFPAPEDEDSLHFILSRSGYKNLSRIGLRLMQVQWDLMPVTIAQALHDFFQSAPIRNLTFEGASIAMGFFWGIHTPAPSVLCRLSCAFV
ncbi:hypothetical protein B0H34DRAFT_196735 [Crassisporium funariophilum]|nr:hypothetical protein B0H34DRAFT_196735 [Crassisporium funariophilum]